MKQGTVAVPRVKAFHEAFMNAIRSNGRVHEIEMIVRYKIKTGSFLEDMALGKEMFSRGRIRLLPEKTRDRQAVREILNRPASDA